MNLTQLSAFHEVMRSNSISQAARKLGRTQPAVSLAIKSLEDTLGCRLFERQGRQLVPVPEAHYLVAETAEILDRISAVSRTMKSLKNARAGSLSIAAMPGPSAFLFPRYISRAIGGNSEIRVSLSSRSSPQIQELARSQAIDFGFTDPPPNPPAHRQYEQIEISADCFCALPADHRLTRQDSISISDLDGEPMGSLYQDTAIFQRIRDAFDRAGARFDQRIDSFIYLPLLQFIGAGQCVALVDPLAVVTDREIGISGGRVVYRPIAPSLRYEYLILSPLHRPLSQLARHVKEGWKEEALRLLTDIGANPELSETAGQNAASSSGS